MIVSVDAIGLIAQIRLITRTRLIKQICLITRIRLIKQIYLIGLTGPIGPVSAASTAASEADRLSLHQDLPFVRAQQPQDQLHGRRLSRSVFSDESVDAVLRHTKAQIVQNSTSAKSL